MAEEVERFQSQLKTKISNKSSSHQSEEGYLVKQFKFFDIYNTGVLDFNNFYRTVEKIGIIMEKEEVRDIFGYLCGVDGDVINYRQYSKDLYTDFPSSSYRAVEKGQTYSPSKHPVLEEDQTHTILRSGMNSADYPLATTSHLYRPTSSAGRKSVMNPDYINKQSYESLAAIQDSESDYPESTPAPNFNYGHEPVYYEHNQYTKTSISKSQTLYIERFREQLILRGGRGLVGLLKQFKIFDADGSGALDRYEFKKAVDDYEIDVHPKDLDNLFNSFDTDHSDSIDYHEFINAIAGALTKYRLTLVEKAFDKLDRDGEGYIDLNDMFAVFDPYRHPDVASGKIDPEGALSEFRDQFEVYHDIVHNYDSSAKVSRDEFVDFYTFVSSQYETDSQFDIMLNGVWNLDNKNNYEEMPYAGSSYKVTKIDSHSAWLNDHHRKMFSGAEYDVISTNKNQYQWQTTHNSKYKTGLEAPSTAAGVPTWPVSAEYLMK